MTLRYVLETWVVPPALGNHLWQSTLFAIAAGLLALLLRKNQARARYWLWLAASVKFLVPFSLLITLGSHLAPPRTVASANEGLYLAIEQVSHPFASTTLPAASHTAAPTAASPSVLRVLPLVLPATWLGGLAAVLFWWQLRWRRVRAVISEAAPLRAGREVEALRRLERGRGMQKPLEMLLSQSSLEPGIFGIVQPVLIWPSGISERLEDVHLEAILAHELWHVRRRDNLAAAIHMVVEAIFWFHPLVWWLGARLVEERERACDEQVVELGSERTAYAESILKTCEFCVEAPLACVSGVTGADLKKRIVRIMTPRLAEKLTFGRKLLLAAIAMAAVAGPVIFGLLHASQVRAQSATTETPALFSFEVASIKPDHLGGHNIHIDFNNNSLIASGVTLKRLIELAYNMHDFQLSGGPGWVDSETYEVQAKMDESTVKALQKLPPAERSQQHRLMVQALLAERFKLKITHSSKELPIYALVLIKSGPKFTQTAAADGSSNFSDHNGDVTVKGLAIDAFARWLSGRVGRKVVDQTGLQGKYDFTMSYDDRRQDLTASGAAEQGSVTPPSDSSKPSIFSALQQLGLKLESKKGPVETLIVDSADKPSPN